MVLIEYNASGDITNLAVADSSIDLKLFPNHALVDETKNPGLFSYWNTSTYDATTSTVTVNQPSSADLLAKAQDARTLYVNEQYAATMASGFTSSADGTSRNYGWQPEDQTHLDLVQSAIDHQVDAFPIEYADINGNSVSLADQTALTQLAKDASAFAWTNVKKRRTLLADIKAATTVAAVLAVTW